MIYADLYRKTSSSTPNINDPMFASTLPPPIQTPSSSCLGWRNWFNLKHGLQQILDNLVLAFLPSALDLVDPRLSLLVGFLLGGLVSLCVLRFVSICAATIWSA